MAKLTQDVLIVKSAALGDVLRTTSLLPALKRRFGGKIWWLTAPGAVPLLAGNPLIDRVATLSSLPGRKFPVVLSLEEDPALARAAVESCAGVLVGIYPEGRRLRYTPSSAKYYDMSLLNPDPDGGHSGADALKKANRLTYAELWLSALGLPRRRVPPRLVLSKAERRRAAAWLSRAKLKRAPIALNAGAGSRWPAKQLDERRAAAVARALAVLGRPVVLLGGADERERNARIAKESGALAAPVQSLRDFAALVERCAAVVTTDSLALHVATALRRPAIVLVGPTSSAELDVFGKGEKILPPSACPCFYKANCMRERHCLDQIPPARVAAAVERWL